jgi:hypothetical protein
MGIKMQFIVIAAEKSLLLIAQDETTKKIKERILQIADEKAGSLLELCLYAQDKRLSSSSEEMQAIRANDLVTFMDKEVGPMVRSMLAASPDHSKNFNE